MNLFLGRVRSSIYLSQRIQNSVLLIAGVESIVVNFIAR